MKLTPLALLLLAGCGGQPFEAGQDDVEFDALLDSSAPAAEASAPDAGPDRGGDDSSAADGGDERDGALQTDTGQACTPIEASVGYDPTACCHVVGNGCSVDIPRHFVMSYNGPDGGCPAGYTPNAPTPPECQCAGLYTCDCLQAASVCDTHHWASCYQGPDGALSVACD